MTQDISTKPYLMRAIYEWCADGGLTPYLAVAVDKDCQVPMDFVRDGEIVLNIGPGATPNLTIDNEWVSFNARFGGVAREIFVPVGAVIGIYAKENGQGLFFGREESSGAEESDENIPPSMPQPDEPGPKRGKPALKIVK